MIRTSLIIVVIPVACLAYVLITMAWERRVRSRVKPESLRGGRPFGDPL